MRQALRRSSTQSQFLLAASLILLLGLALRLAGSMRLPLFIDEAIHLQRAHAINHGVLFAGNIRKWFYPVVLSWFDPSGPEGAWIARTISALCSTITIASCIGLGRVLDRPRTGLIAGLLYALLPFALFHERQALADPLLAALLASSTLIVVWIARKPRLIYAMLLGVLLAFALLTKLAALPYVILPLIGPFLLAPRQRRARALLISAAALVIAGGITAYFFRLSIDTEAPPTAESPDETVDAAPNTDPFYLSAYYLLHDNIVRVTGSTPGDGLSHLPTDLSEYAEIQWKYVGWAALALIGLAAVWALRGIHWREFAYLSLPGIAFAVGPLLADRPTGFLAARYLLATAAPLTVIAALGITTLLTRYRQRDFAFAAALILLVGVVQSGISFAAALIANPARAPLVESDVIQYVTGSPSGVGFSDAAAIIAQAWRESGKPVYVIANGTKIRLAAQLGPRAVLVEDFRQDDPHQILTLAEHLANGEQVFVFDADTTESLTSEPRLPESPHGAKLRMDTRYVTGSGTLTLYRVIGAEGPLADLCYAASVPSLVEMSPEVAALQAALQNSPAQTRLIFPADPESQVDTNNSNLRPIPIREWPLTSEVAQQAVDALELGSDGTPVEVVLIDEAYADPHRTLMLALYPGLYPVDEAWFGLIHRRGFVTGPADPPFQPLDAAFEGTITLEDAAILDPQVHPGDMVRIALRWRTDMPIADSFHVFTHLIDGSDTLIAQHDGIPGAGLYDLTSWQPGNPIIDHFAVTIPPGTPPGELTIRVGIYRPDNGLRLRVVDAANSGPDYVIVGRVQVVSAN